MLEHCTESCGWIAAIASIFAWGSFGAPIKGKTCSRLNVDPLVIQTYKTFFCFITSWLAIPLLGVEGKFTPWGIVSGIFWVPGAMAGIYGIKNAGLAISVGTWSSIVVLSSFFWGVFVFREGVKSVPRACCAVLLLCTGLVGMAKYSQPPLATESKNIDNGDNSNHIVKTGHDEMLSDYESDGGLTDEERVTRKRVKKIIWAENGETQQIDEVSTPSATTTVRSALPLELEMEPLVQVNLGEGGANYDKSAKAKSDMDWNFGIGENRVTLTRRQMGILCAAFNGGWGGMCLVPLHYAREDGFGGPGYVISFGCGAMIVTIWIWALRYLYNLDLMDYNFRDAHDMMPSFHVREMWLPGSLAGILYSIGNFGSIVAVSALGQGVGYSCTQLSMLVSGLWGIFFFQEIKGNGTILGWFFAASVTVTGILWLSFEHEGGGAH
mmetsp:Transcript_14889/g.18942  ORF Transcript_14889/g.18942 Transcript_14889/m.18942 type:complete len:438 (+) Transcript_14889:36-1349(+)